MEESDVIFCATISSSITLRKAINIANVKNNLRSGKCQIKPPFFHGKIFKVAEECTFEMHYTKYEVFH